MNVDNVPDINEPVKSSLIHLFSGACAALNVTGEDAHIPVPRMVSADVHMVGDFACNNRMLVGSSAVAWHSIPQMGRPCSSRLARKS